MANHLRASQSVSAKSTFHFLIQFLQAFTFADQNLPGDTFDLSVSIRWLFLELKFFFCFEYFEIIQTRNRTPKTKKYWCGRTCITVRRPKNMQKISPQSYETQIKIVALNPGYLNQALNNPVQELCF